MIYTPKNTAPSIVYIRNNMDWVEIKHVFEIDDELKTLSFYPTDADGETILIKDYLATCTIFPEGCMCVNLNTSEMIVKWQL